MPLLHAKSVVDLGNIESVFGIIEMARLVGRLPNTPSEEIERISAATRRVLSDTVELRCRFRRDDGGWRPTPDYLSIAGFIEKEELQRERGAIALVTFNYDLALDMALHWSHIPIDYCVSPSELSGIPLLKLHGSLNWSLCTGCLQITPIPLSRIFELEPAGHWRESDKTSGILATRCLTANGAHCNDAPATNIPGIVPPSWNKTQYHKSFSLVWQRAAKELAEASEIYVIGYSLPQSDSFFRDLLALGLVGSTRLKRFEVVDPDTNAADRFRELLGPDCRERFIYTKSTFSDWARTRFGDSPRTRAT